MKLKPVATIVVLMGVTSVPAVFQAAAAPDPVGALAIKAPKPKFYDNVAFDVSPPLRELAAHRATPVLPEEDQGEVREENGPEAIESDVYFPDAAVQSDISPLAIDGAPSARSYSSLVRAIDLHTLLACTVSIARHRGLGPLS